MCMSENERVMCVCEREPCVYCVTKVAFITSYLILQTRRGRRSAPGVGGLPHTPVGRLTEPASRCCSANRRRRRKRSHRRLRHQRHQRRPQRVRVRRSGGTHSPRDDPKDWRQRTEARRRHRAEGNRKAEPGAGAVGTDTSWAKDAAQYDPDVHGDLRRPNWRHLPPVRIVLINQLLGSVRPIKSGTKNS